MKVKNIQTRLFIIFLPLIFLVVSVLSGASYYLSRQALEKSISQTATAVGTDYSNRVKGDINVMISQLEGLASIQDISTGSDKKLIVKAMAENQKRFGTFDVIVFISPDGAGTTNTGATFSYNDRDYFKKVISTKKVAVSDPLVSKSTGKLAVVLAVPVMHNDQLTGVLVGTFSVNRLTNVISNLKFLDTGYGQLADDGGTIIAHPQHPEFMGKLNLREKKINSELKMPKTELDDSLLNLFKSAAESNQQVQGIYTFVDDIPRIAVLTPIDLPGSQRWVMTIAAPANEATLEINTLAHTMLILSLICLFIAAVSVVFIARTFAKPIILIRDECLLLSQGDLRKREITIFSEDEIGQLAKGFQEMRKNLHELITKVYSQSKQLAASSEELTASAAHSAHAANQVAESINQVANSAEKQVITTNKAATVVEKMSSGIQQVSTNTNLAAGKSAQAAEKANEGGKSLEKSVNQMTQIEQTVNSSAQVVAKLGERSKEIGQIVDTIAGIAGQTNLLALNAAIEAARAGEQGRGFAVVAEEVRKLAEQSQDAAKEIAKLISEIQEDTDKAVIAMSEGTHEVKIGTEVVTSARYAFKEIATLVLEVSSQVKEISVAIQQMASGSQQIVSSVNEIDNLSKNTAGEAQKVSAATEEQSASMEEIASSTQNLATLALNLQEAVSRFQI
ncbi:methyl-accepting chemotaxis protein [Pelosinus sp. sgz500959]|uniref:methyl-accepting chemotaxis protein n=1 Tax=Pelosinus sp. sgz500959 TaxID=3242472 RepID=UPI00366FD852